MTNLEKRVAKMEQAADDVDLKSMTDDELRAYAAKCPSGSSEMYAAVLTLVGRRKNQFTVVHDDPERPSAHKQR